MAVEANPREGDFAAPPANDSGPVPNVDATRGTADTRGMARSYKCPYCNRVQRAEPLPEEKVTVTCDACGGRFRIPAAQEKARVQTSIAAAQVRKELQAHVDASRSDDDKLRLKRIIDERRLGDYEILDELGRGGMGVVFKAFHRHLKRMVALKVILPDADDPETMLRRFKREAELHARLSHPNIVHVYDYGVIDGMHYFAMDFVTGTQLTKLIGSPEFQLAERLHVVTLVAEALEHAHGQGVVHRDVKPDNVIVDAGWNPHVVDFGIAKATDNSGMESITRQGLAVGTPHYMAPEQFRPKLGAVGPQSDVYAVGAVLYHILAGKTPFDSDTAHGVLIKAATQEAPPLVGLKTPSDELIDEDLAAIVKRCMTKELAKRYPSAKSLAADLRRYTAGLEVEANPLSGKARLRRQLKKNPGAVTLFGLTGALLLAIAVTLVVIGMIWSIRDGQLSSTLAGARTIVLSNCKGGCASAEQAIANVEAQLAVGSTSIVWITLVGIVVFGAALSAVAYKMMSQRLAETLPVTPAARPDEIGQTADEVASKTGL